MNNDTYTSGTFLQFSPSIIFISLYFFFYIYISITQNLYYPQSTIISGLPLFVAFITIFYAFFTFKEIISIHKKIEIFFNGSMNVSLAYFHCTFIGAATFTHILAKTGVLATLTSLHIILLPSQWVLPYLFFISFMIAMLLQSWIVSIMLCIPIAYGIAFSLQINPALMTATIISGIMSGYQIIMPSNYETLKEKLWLIIPALTCTLLILSMYQYQTLHVTLYKQLATSLSLQDYIALLPLTLFLVTAALRIDMIANLFFGSVIGITVGVLQHTLLFLDETSCLLDGFINQKSMVKIMFFIIFLSAIMKTIHYNNGFDYIISKLKIRIKKLYLAQLMIILIISIINLIAAFDILSMQILDSIIKKLSKEYNLPDQRSLALLQITTTTISCFIPYAPIILVSSYLSRISSLEIIRYMFYPIILYCMTIISIFIFKYEKIK